MKSNARFNISRMMDGFWRRPSLAGVDGSSQRKRGLDGLGRFLMAMNFSAEMMQ
jgi:hypothetical protein